MECYCSERFKPCSNNRNFNLIYESQCVWVCGCVSAIEIQTTGLILMKFGMGILLNMGKVHSWVVPHTLTPNVRGALKRVLPASAASTVWLGENFIKTNVVGYPCFSGGRSLFRSLIWIWKDLGPMYLWSRGQSFSGRVNKTKVVVHLPKSWLVQVLTS